MPTKASTEFDWINPAPMLETDRGSMNWIDNPAALEAPDTLPAPIMYRRQRRRRTLAALRQEKLAEFFTELPRPGESIHVISNGSFDYWNFVPICLRLMKQPAAEFYGSTWTMSRPNALSLLELFDEGQIKKIALFSGLYFKRRETAVYATISTGLLDRGQRFLCFENHTKIIMLAATRGPTRIVIEGSANFTANPRVENMTVINDPDLYQFHRQWMEGTLDRCQKLKQPRRPKI